MSGVAERVLSRYRQEMALRDQCAPFGTVGVLEDLDGPLPRLPRAARVVARFKEAIIRKEKGEYCVRSPANPDWNGGCYPSKDDAEDRLREVEYFKRK